MSYTKTLKWVRLYSFIFAFNCRNCYYKTIDNYYISISTHNTDLIIGIEKNGKINTYKNLSLKILGYKLCHTLKL